MAKKQSAPQTYVKPDQIVIRGNEIFSPLRKKWLKDTPEEHVRQEFIQHLHVHYGYDFEQMAQERKTQHGRRSPRTDIVVYNAVGGSTPIIVVECKAESVNIQLRDYYQGESYARATGCEFLVTHNRRQTAIFKLVPGTPGEAVQINDLPRVEDWGDAKRIEAIKNSTRAFSRKEFQDLLFKCHSILRDVHKMEPGRAFDAISKILFIKMYIERTGAWGTFTTDYLDQRKAVSLPTDKPVHEQLFDQTKKHYANSEIFSARDELEVSEETFRRIVKELARFNLSATGDDIKGLAFERFLGDTFRGELGQFFTPRPIVDFMVDLLDPQESELICDPAAGSGGFLIRAFEHVRDKIGNDIQIQKDNVRTAIEAKHLKEEEETRQIEEAFIRLNRELDPEQTDPPSRVRKLAYDCIFGTDAEPRAARTAKMNMIMHGDGHGGIHYHDGLVDINGVFAGRFALVLTNPPFGQNVGEDQKYGGSEETRVPKDDTYCKHCLERYGAKWEESHNRTMKFASGEPDAILEGFEIGKDKPNRPTELLFLERCIQLLRPGGRMGIVLPDGNLNNPSLSWLRRWAESKARLLAVVSLPEETFRSADATVKASLVFLERFTESDSAAWEDAWQRAHAKYDALNNADRSRLCTEYGPRIASAEHPDIVGILHELVSIGVYRQLPDWKQAEPPFYPRGVGMTMVGSPRWVGETTDKKRARALKQKFQEAWSADVARNADTLLRALRASLRKVDKVHNAALWHEVRELFDYPVFTAAPETVGITSTGAEGPNQLPDVLIAYRKFAVWVDAGAKPEEIPEFGA
ncbi:MAG: N-6 DNA methylase [Deltaproteobacteria bacterium]|nr:N-6 DNA methylase [Deltaproteobacteria bacterium]